MHIHMLLFSLRRGRVLADHASDPGLSHIEGSGSNRINDKKTSCFKQDQLPTTLHYQSTIVSI